MAELKMTQYLLEEEQLILKTMKKLQEQLNKLKVEELNLMSAIRNKQSEERSAAPLPQVEKLPDCKTQAEENEEPTNSEEIDLRVDNILSAPMDISSQPRDTSGEEDEEDET
ncbi:hypothetical protein HPB49_008193 [Dermacentor silvarum]|uniref:Uncharacterized protein n=1 Tax=Dermacentor silvarum TaxID=543639 RepID=A0ACB8DXU5_DERSI|nr:uncharacterized protein LOC119452812 [Dermacentor silvarum]KAH7979100.1 hypothetical protein HPB49_008193 [Dermacentor silvarum]